MGGTVCAILIRSIVRFDAVPTNPHDQKTFEAQIRQCYATDTIAESVGTEISGVWKQVCDSLKKPSPLSKADLDVLWDALEEYRY